MKIKGKHYKDRQAAFKWLKDKKIKYRLDLHFNRTIISHKAIDIIIPAVNKDADVLPYVIDAARNNIRHPVDKIFIIAPDTPAIKKLALEKKCTFVDETSVLGFGKEKISYNYKGNDRSGWLFQQLLKLSGDKISGKPYFLLLDADTVFIRPKIFYHLGKSIVDCADEYCTPYYKTYEKLTGMKHDFPLSFITHYQFINASILKELKAHIEQMNNKPWYEAIISLIDEKEQSFFSEYETYANFALARHYSKFIIEYWYNISLPKRELENIAGHVVNMQDSFKSVSFHDYNP